MILVDASALVAIIADEPEALLLAQAIALSPSAATHPLSLWEAGIVLARMGGAPPERARDRLLSRMVEANVAVLAIEGLDASAAVDAHARYGKGRHHPAQLNMGDCFSYAMAKRRGLKLLYRGDDFAQTDIESALA